MAPEVTADGTVLPASLAAGHVIDGFRLEERTHRGGMASLWRVSRVAAPASGAGEPALIMKVPSLRAGEDPATIVGFEVEQMIMPTLAGPHVPAFVAKGDLTRLPYIVMERIDGPTLRVRFDAAPLPIDEVAQIGWKVATALHDLHRQHVIHLDVKPSNVLFRPSGEAVLIDYGLARHDALPDLLEEEFELPMGTGPYMSPEQVQFVRDEPRSDLFALGVLLYHCTTGARPFGSPDSVRGLRRRLWRDPVPPRALRADCPPWLQEIILRCLEVDPERRHRTAAQLAFDLADPAQVALTERAGRLQRSGRLATARRWFAAIGHDARGRGAGAQTARSPIVVAALDLLGAEPPLLDAIRTAVRRLLETEPGARLACLAVMKTSRIAMDELTEADGSSRHLNLLVKLRHWAHELEAPAQDATRRDAAAHDPAKARTPREAARITFHVLEAPDPAVAIVDYVRRNRVDHVVMGARSSGGLRRYLGSVSAQVVAEADCTVTVVRASAVLPLQPAMTPSPATTAATAHADTAPLS
jgi:nucleotide-binding universal stress UspA family protein